jgi:hypothetical protein
MVKLSSVIFLINTLNDGISMLVNDLFEDKFNLSEMAEELSDIVTAREMIGQAIQDSKQFKHRYFEFLKYIREKHGEEYSTRVHQKAAKLAIAKERD